MTKVLMMNKFLYARAGAETYMLSVAHQWKNQGLEIGFFGMDHPDLSLPGPAFTFEALNFGPAQGRLAKAKNLVKAASQTTFRTVEKEFRHCLDSFQPDIIHAHNLYNQISPALPGMAKGIPTVMTVHDFKPVCPSYNLFLNGEACTKCLPNRFYHAALNRCCHGKRLDSTLAALSAYKHSQSRTYDRCYDHYISPSQFMKNALVQGDFSEDRVEVVHNFAALPDQNSAPGNSLFYFGRLCREKGVDTLLKAYARMPDPRPDLVIAGEGPLAQQLKDFAAAQGLDRIQWLGFVDQATIQKHLTLCGCVVVPSVWHENCSMVIMESLAHQRPVIASDTGGNPELVQPHVNGMVFPAGDDQALAEAMSTVLQDRTVLETLSKQAGASAQKRFSPEVHMAALKEIYERLLKRPVGSTEEGSCS